MIWICFRVCGSISRLYVFLALLRCAVAVDTVDRCGRHGGVDESGAEKIINNIIVDFLSLSPKRKVSQQAPRSKMTRAFEVPRKQAQSAHFSQ